MTIVVYDGIHIAADKQLHNGFVKSSINKLWHCGDSVYGFAGSLSAVGAFKHWVHNGKDVDNFPAVVDTNKGIELYVIEVKKDGTCWLYENCQYPTLMTDYPVVIGAEAAMFAVRVLYAAPSLLYEFRNVNIDAIAAVRALCTQPTISEVSAFDVLNWHPVTGVSNEHE